MKMTDEKKNSEVKKEVKKDARFYYNTLEYGPAPESPEGVNAWLDSHNRKFGLFIDNQWVHPEGRKYANVVCPAKKDEVMCQSIQCSAEDVDTAVKSARKGFEVWSKLTPHERAKHLYSLARHVQKHARLFAVIESMNNGKPFRESKNADVNVVIRWLYHHAGWAQLMGQDRLQDYKPLGVVSCIVPFNFPLMLLVWQVCPALCTGNSVVVKVASTTRMSALLFAHIVAEAGLPPGVFNVLTGPGASIGSAIVDHPDIDKVTLTGSTDTGRLLRRRIAGSGKKISLELGGKSPMIVFDTADIDSAVEGVVDAIWFNQGQVCCAGSRLLLQESIADKMIAKLKARMAHFRLGHSLEKNIDMGAVVDENQYKTIKGFCEEAEKQGATVYKAPIPVPDLAIGWFWPPTLIYNVTPSHHCVEEEIFGPVVSVITFRSPDEAVALANNNKYGLAASVWTENVSLAVEIALRVKAGSVWINAHNLFDAAAGFGGYKESGFGRDGGFDGLLECVRPVWENRPRPSLKFPTMKAEWPNQVLPVPQGEAQLAKAQLAKTALGLPVDRTAKLYINGKQARPDGEYSITVLAADGTPISEVPDASRKDVRNAVEAAVAAAPGWGRRAAHNRAQICYYIAENLNARAEEFAKRIALMTGCSPEAAAKEVATSIERLFFYAAYADKFGGSVAETAFYGATMCIYEPRGVIGIACPDEFPLLGFVSLLAPALVRGNTVVIVPSQKWPLCATDLYQVFDTSDLPAGVCNILTGQREVLMKTLTEHMEVDCVWYHGTEEGSRDVEFASSDNMKRSWVNYGVKRNWMSEKEGQGRDFLYEAVEVKHVWVPMGECSF